MDSSLAFAAFLAVSSLIVHVWMLLDRRRNRVDERVAELATPAGPALPPITDLFQDAAERRLSDAAKRDLLKNRIVRAGLYKPEAAAAFMIVRLVLAAGLAGLAILASSYTALPKTYAFMFAAMAAILGTVAPGLWLDRLQRARQTRIRRALPDALDVMVVCLEGGLSLQGTLSRVGRELDTAHPLLAHELGIVDREIQLGRSTGDAMRQMAERFDLEELRSLASVISQTERYGAGVVAALLVYSETMRTRRRQRAEEMAQKATIKMVFPTLLCIFPGLFIVLLGPAAIQIYNFVQQVLLHRHF
jgi:tight adherence protein C